MQRQRRWWEMGVAVLVILSLGWTCNASNWLALALEDLPVLTQQAQNILTVVDPQDAALAQTVSTATLAALQIVKDAVDAYNANPSAATLKKVQEAMDAASPDINNALQSVASKFLDKTDLLIVTTVLAGIVTTLDIIANQIGPPSTARQLRMSKASATVPFKGKKVPRASDLKAYWNEKVCSVGSGHPCPKM